MLGFGGFYFGFGGFVDFGGSGRGCYDCWVRQKLLWNWHFWEFSCLEVVFWVCGLGFILTLIVLGGIADLFVFGLLICGDFEFFGVNFGVCVVCVRTLLEFAILGFFLSR